MIELREQSVFVERHLRELGTWLDLPALEKHADELAANEPFKSAIEAAVADVAFFHTKHWDGLLRLGLYRATQFALTRALGAATVVEAGVLHGLSSSFLLQGLADNDNGGRLVSIDAPSTFEDGPANTDGFTDTLPPGLGPGWIVPDNLRALWDLRLGLSTDLLPEILDDLEPIDLYIHDSDHTYRTMMFEFETVWPSLATGGVLIADNIDVNTSFFDFSRAVGRTPFVLPVDPDHVTPGASGIRCGVLRK